MLTKNRSTIAPRPSGVTHIAVQRACAARGAPGEGSLRAAARAAAGRSMEVTLRIVGSAEARRLNRRYRRADCATNVLAFAHDAVLAERAGGDIVLCHAVIAREAGAQQKTLAAHYLHLVVHGMLHLRGYDHATPRQAARMERIETRILRRLGLPNPYLVR